MAVVTFRHEQYCLLVNATLWGKSPQGRPTMHIVGLHSIDCLQIVGVGRLHISYNLWLLGT